MMRKGTPFCAFEESKVIDSRPTDEGERIRRRRECLKCAKRFTTYEMIESLPIVVIKKDKSRETFDRQKLMTGINALRYISAGIRQGDQSVDIHTDIAVFTKFLHCNADTGF